MRVLISASELAERTQALADELTEHYSDVEEPIVMVGILRGSFIFMADLARGMQRPLEVDFMSASSYGDSTVSSGEVKLKTDLRNEITGRHVLVVEDIVDTGHTLAKLRTILTGREPASLKFVSLLDKPSRRENDEAADWVGFTIEDLFVVGYGLDEAGLSRNLPYVGVKSTD
jgi:hypoxanthine phosphoribosyltransferase